MRKYLLIALMSSVLASAMAIDGYSESKEELTEAMSAGDQILLIFGASWCGPCKKMKSDVWTVSSFVNFVDGLGVKKFYFDTDSNSDLASEWGITTIPTWFTVQAETTITQNGSMTIRGVEKVISESFPE